MEIYKIRDFEKKEDVDANAELRITDLRQAVKNENRVNVFVNNKYSFSLDISQAVDFHLKKGLVISAEQLTEYKRASEFGKLYQRTLEWTLTRPHSKREVSDYLARKLKMSISETLGPARRYGRAGAHSLLVSRESSSMDISEFSQTIIARLISKGYIDDKRFAEYYVENRFVKKGISRKRLRMELVKKGIASSIIDEVLDGRNDEEEIKKMILKKRAKYTQEKLIAYLCRQGFDYQLVKDLVQIYGMDSQNLE